MQRYSRWVKRELTCPEEMGDTELLIEWLIEGEKEFLNGISCSNPYLRDLSGGDCRWSCWEKVATEEAQY